MRALTLITLAGLLAFTIQPAFGTNNTATNTPPPTDNKNNNKNGAGGGNTGTNVNFGASVGNGTDINDVGPGRGNKGGGASTNGVGNGGTGNKGNGGGGAGGGNARGGSGSDQVILQQSAQVGLMEIAMAQLALTNSQDAAVHQLAEHLIADHTTQLQQLQAVADELDTTLPETLASKDRATVDRLASSTGTQFDRAWLNAMVTSHQMALTLHTRGAQRGRNENVRAYARGQLIPLATHLAQALELLEQFQSGATSLRR